MTSRRRGLLACVLGVSLAIGLLFSLYIPGLPLPHQTFTSSETGIAVEKLIFLDYFIFMPWPVTNLMRVDHFKQIDYDDPVEEGGLFVVLFHSTFFLVGALLAVVFSRSQRIDDSELRRKVFLRPWVLYTLLMQGAHLVLIGAAATYYTGPGGPVWVYPTPYFLIPFAIWIGGLSYVAQVIDTVLREGVYYMSLLGAILTYVVLTGLAAVLRNNSWMLLVAMVFMYIYLICACLVALYKHQIAPMRIEMKDEKERPRSIAIITILGFIGGFIVLLFGIVIFTGVTAGTLILLGVVLRSIPGILTPVIYEVLFTLGGVVLIILATLLLFVSWGLWNSNNWARVLVGILFSVGALSDSWTLIWVIIHGVDQLFTIGPLSDFWILIQVVTIFPGALVRLIIECLFIYYLTRPHVVEYFQ